MLRAPTLTRPRTWSRSTPTRRRPVTAARAAVVRAAGRRLVGRRRCSGALRRLLLAPGTRRARPAARRGASLAAEASATRPAPANAAAAAGRRQHGGVRAAEPVPAERTGGAARAAADARDRRVPAVVVVPRRVVRASVPDVRARRRAHGPGAADGRREPRELRGDDGGGARLRASPEVGAPPEVVRRKFASAKGLSDLKPFYGKVFEELLQGGCTHWGWVDWDVLAGDLRAAIPQAQLWEYDAVTLPGATLGFAWAGQLSVFQNTAELRELYRVVGDHVALGFKCCATEGNKEAGQSGWEERVFLRDVLRTAAAARRVQHGGAVRLQGAVAHLGALRPLLARRRVARAAAAGAAGAAAAPARRPRLRQGVDPARPAGLLQEQGRACIRWDLTSSPWMCCPHSTGVTYTWTAPPAGALTPHRNASADELAALNALGDARSAAAAAAARRRRVRLCLEGAFFHAGLTPIGGDAPACGARARRWALLDDIGRFGQARPPRRRDVPAAGGREERRADADGTEGGPLAPSRSCRSRRASRRRRCPWQSLGLGG